VPDIYQGQEMWDFSLVDPDNRRPVDYSIRQEIADQTEKQPPRLAELLEEWRDGRIKLFVTLKLLRLRRERPELFTSGSYTPVAVAGRFAECCVAFVREHKGATILVVVPRLSLRVGNPPIGAAWADTRLEMPKALGAGKALFADVDVSVPGGPLPLREVLREFPVAVWQFGG
jgi:(1->4)-alpha-D-glucan 1-alpha-D-glucosylmutase